MIGRTEKVKPFELIRWARAQARESNLSPREAHVLLLLATYANDEATCWPSIRTLALDCGLTPTKDGRNSSVSAAISRLEEARLVWTKQAGAGHSARRELLFDPAKWRPKSPVEGESGRTQPSRPQDGCESAHVVSLPESRTTAFLVAGPEVPENSQSQLPNSNGQRQPSRYAEGCSSYPQEGNDERRDEVRAAIHASLASVHIEEESA